MNSSILKIALGVFIGNLLTALFGLLLVAIGVFSLAGVSGGHAPAGPIEVDVRSREITVPDVGAPRR